MLAHETFPEVPDLQRRVNKALEDPQQAPLINDICNYVATFMKAVKREHNHVDEQQNGISQPPTKKRRLSEDKSTGPTTSIECEIKDISFSTPLRKKLNLELVRGGFRAVNGTTGKAEFGMSWDQVDLVACVSVPEKATSTYNFIVVPITLEPPGAPSCPDSYVWTIPGDTYPKTANSKSEEGRPRPEDSYQTLLTRIINRELSSYNKKVITPNEKEFVSTIVEAHRKNDLSYAVKAFRGSKDGFLYLLSEGILFGFRKPVLFFPFRNITSTSYTSVLQRTFNFNINVESEIVGNSQEFEFSMLDQAHFAGIDAYVKRHGLNDHSLALERQAKRYNVNKPKAAKDEPEAIGSNSNGVEEEGELAKAQQALEDEEEQEEEDYDPGSEGESEGSGSSDEEEEEEMIQDHDEVNEDDDE